MALPGDGGQARSGTLTVDGAVMYEQRLYVRLHVRFRVTCQAAMVDGEVRFGALT